MSVSKKIIEYLEVRYPQVVHKGDILKMSGEWGHMADYVGRECRRLARRKKILAHYNEQNEVMYSYILPEKNEPPRADSEPFTNQTSPVSTSSSGEIYQRLLF